MQTLLAVFSLLWNVSFDVVHVVPTKQTLDGGQPVRVFSNVSGVVNLIRSEFMFKRWTMVFVHRGLTVEEVGLLAREAEWIQLSRWVFLDDRFMNFLSRSDTLLLSCVTMAYHRGVLDIPRGYRNCDERALVAVSAENTSSQLEQMDFIGRLVVVCRAICWDFEEFQDIVHALTGHAPAILNVNLDQPAREESEEVFFRLRARQGDLVLTRHVFSEERLAQVGYTSVSSFAQNHFVIKRVVPHRMGSFGIINIFDHYCWTGILAVLIVFTFMVNVKARNLGASAMQVIGCMLQVCVVLQKRRNNIIYIAMFAGSILFCQVFRGKMLSSFNILSHSDFASTIDHLNKLLKEGQVRVCVFDKDFLSSLITIDANLEVLRLLAEAKLKRRLFDAGREECVALTARNTNVISILSSADIYTVNYTHLVDISTQAVVERVSGFLISPGHPLTSKLNRIVHQMLDMAVFDQIKMRYLLRWKVRTLSNQATVYDRVEKLRFWDIALAMFIWTGGLLTASVAFVVEICR